MNNIRTSVATDIWTTMELSDLNFAQRLISDDFKVTKQHGEFVEKNGILMMGTFHPAALLRNPNNMPLALEDFLQLREKINEICEHTY